MAMPDVNEFIWEVIKPSIAPFLMVTGAITIYKNWHRISGRKKEERRKVSDEVVLQLVEIIKQNSRSLERLVEILDVQKELLEECKRDHRESKEILIDIQKKMKHDY